MSEWISVNERLPDVNDNAESDYVLVWDDFTEQVQTGFYHAGDKSFYDLHGIDRFEDPTHWMPLPKRP